MECDGLDNGTFGAVIDTCPDLLNNRYLKEWNREPPSFLDPATTNASARQQICEDITHSGVFEFYFKYPLNMNNLYDRVSRLPRHEHIIQRIYRPSNGLITSTVFPHQFNSPYQIKEFEIISYLEDISVHLEEHVFACPLVQMRLDDGSDSSSEEEDENNGEENDYTEDEEVESEEEQNAITMVYVSKMYDEQKGLNSHRFVFGAKNGLMDVLLVERSAEAYIKPDFNVELHYLELRKHHQPVEAYNLDPLCEVSREHSEVVRVCSVILSSSYFKENAEYMYEHRASFSSCFRQRISFRTEEGHEKSGSEEYSEIMISCYAKKILGGPQVFYISRAYNPHQVFVYIEDDRNDKFYIDHLSTNVGIVQDRYNLGKVEI